MEVNEISAENPTDDDSVESEDHTGRASGSSRKVPKRLNFAFGTLVSRENVGLEQRAQHRASCHRCGNMRRNNIMCSKCPHIYCARCSHKMVEQHGHDIFMNGCPVCKQLCCCANKSNTCNRLYHCYKKCPTTKAGLSQMRETPTTIQSTPTTQSPRSDQDSDSATRHTPQKNISIFKGNVSTNTNASQRDSSNLSIGDLQLSDYMSMSREEKINHLKARVTSNRSFNNFSGFSSTSIGSSVEQSESPPRRRMRFERNFNQTPDLSGTRLNSHFGIASPELMIGGSSIRTPNQFHTPNSMGNQLDRNSQEQVQQQLFGRHQYMMPTTPSTSLGLISTLHNATPPALGKLLLQGYENESPAVLQPLVPPLESLFGLTPLSSQVQLTPEASCPVESSSQQAIDHHHPIGSVFSSSSTTISPSGINLNLHYSNDDDYEAAHRINDSCTDNISAYPSSSSSTSIRATQSPTFSSPPPLQRLGESQSSQSRSKPQGLGSNHACVVDEVLSRGEVKSSEMVLKSEGSASAVGKDEQKRPLSPDYRQYFMNHPPQLLLEEVMSPKKHGYVQQSNDAPVDNEGDFDFDFFDKHIIPFLNTTSQANHPGTATVTATSSEPTGYPLINEWSQITHSEPTVRSVDSNRNYRSHHNHGNNSSPIKHHRNRSHEHSYYQPAASSSNRRHRREEYNDADDEDDDGVMKASFREEEEEDRRKYNRITFIEETALERERRLNHQNKDNSSLHNDSMRSGRNLDATSYYDSNHNYYNHVQQMSQNSRPDDGNQSNPFDYDRNPSQSSDIDKPFQLHSLIQFPLSHFMKGDDTKSANEMMDPIYETPLQQQVNGEILQAKEARPVFMTATTPSGQVGLGDAASSVTPMKLDYGSDTPTYNLQTSPLQSYKGNINVEHSQSYSGLEDVTTTLSRSAGRVSPETTKSSRYDTLTPSSYYGISDVVGI